MGVDHGSRQGLPSGYPTGSQGDLQQEMASFLSIARSQGRRSRQIQELEHREKILLTAMETIETIGHWAKSRGCQMIHANCWRKCEKKKTVWKTTREALVQVQLIRDGTSPFQAILESIFLAHHARSLGLGKRMENAHIIRPWCFRLPF